MTPKGTHAASGRTRSVNLRLSKKIAAATVALCLLAGAATGEIHVFSGRINGQNVRLQADSTRVGEIEYISLPTLVERLGGGVDMRGTRMRIDLFGITAWVAYGDERVVAQSIVSLAHPILRWDNDAFVAVDRYGQSRRRTRCDGRSHDVESGRRTGLRRPSQ